MTSGDKKTFLFDQHKSAKAKIVPFGGWMMPVSYEGVLAEHKAVREHCGVFDVSHMGEIEIKGPDARAFLQYLTINDVDKIEEMQGQYSAILRPDGGMVDDLIVYKITDSAYFICVNASNTDKDYLWFVSNKGKFNVTIANESDQWSQLAVQGPNSKMALGILLGPADKSKFDALGYTCMMPVRLFGKPCWVARTGYTGEHGYEVYVPNDIASLCWMALLETSHKTGIKPIGLGARDTLRLEACYLLYGNDMDDSVSPLEAGISWAVKLDKPDFIGREALLKQKAEGVTRKIAAFKMCDDGIPRHGMDCYQGGQAIGKVTSGSVLPTLGGSGGMALLSAALKIGDEFEIDIRGKRKLARVAKRPLYTPKVK